RLRGPRRLPARRERAAGLRQRPGRRAARRGRGSRRRLPVAGHPDRGLSMSARVVVAGASMAGLRAAEQLRATGWTGTITIVGDEPHMPYQRPPLSKDVLAGKAPFESLAFRPRASV